MTHRERTTHKKARISRWIIRPRPDGIYIDKGGIEDGPFREGEVLTEVAKYLTTSVAPIVLGPNASLGRLSEAEHTYTESGQHTPPFIVYDRTGRELDRGWNLPGLFRRYQGKFLRASYTPRTLEDWDAWEPDPGTTKAAGVLNWQPLRGYSKLYGGDSRNGNFAGLGSAFAIWYEDSDDYFPHLHVYKTDGSVDLTTARSMQPQATVLSASPSPDHTQVVIDFDGSRVVGRLVHHAYEDGTGDDVALRELRKHR